MYQGIWNVKFNEWKTSAITVIAEKWISYGLVKYDSTINANLINPEFICDNEILRDREIRCCGRSGNRYNGKRIQPRVIPSYPMELAIGIIRCYKWRVMHATYVDANCTFLLSRAIFVPCIRKLHYYEHFVDFNKRVEDQRQRDSLKLKRIRHSVHGFIILQTRRSLTRDTNGARFAWNWRQKFPSRTISSWIEAKLLPEFN